MWKKHSTDTMAPQSRYEDDYMDWCDRYVNLRLIKETSFEEMVESYGSKTILHTGTKVMGSYSSSCNLYLAGKIEGECVDNNATIYISETGGVISKIKSDNLFVSGEINGSIETDTISYFEKKARVKVTEIKTNVCVMNEGVQFNGSVTSTCGQGDFHQQTDNPDYLTSHEQYYNLTDDFQRATELNLNIIGASASIDGDIHCQENELIIFGTVNGNVHAPNRAIILAKNAIVMGDITCQDLFIEGQMKGNVCVSDSVFLSKRASLEGSLTACRLNMEGGCSFSGKVHLSGESLMGDDDSNTQWRTTETSDYGVNEPHHKIEQEISKE